MELFRRRSLGTRAKTAELAGHGRAGEGRAHPAAQPATADQVAWRGARPAAPSQPLRATNERFAFLDGLRALAALAVVIVHAFEMFGLNLGSFWGLPADQSGLGEGDAQNAFRLVHELVVGQFVWAVEVFIVISGFSLMLAIVRTPGGRLRGGVGTFFQRRAWRILPPYYSALLVGLLAIVLVPGMSEPSGSYHYRDLMLPATTPGPLISHMLLVHNWSTAWDLKIVPPMWSIAVEWQLYALFPLLVLLWRAAGTLAMVLVAGGVGLAQAVLSQQLGWPTYPLSHAWFLALFALGMAGAAIGFARQPALERLRARVPWLALGALTFMAIAGAKVAARGSGGVPEWIGDPILGLAVMCLLVHLVVRSAPGPGQRGLIHRVLTLPPLVSIGQFSYSLYLLHVVVLTVLSLVFDRLGLAGLPAHLLMLLIGVPASLAAAYLFFLAFERPFLASRARERQARNAEQLPALREG